MANFEALKTLIRQYIKENGNGEITGDILQSVLIAMVTEVEGNGYVYAGIATPTTEPVTGNVFYIAIEAGSYSNFGSVDVSAGITILKRDGTSWTKNQISYTDGVFDISAYNGSSYANLSAALGTNGANVPLAVRKGGMSIKFVTTSDKLYHQFRYLLEYANTTAGNAAFVNVSNWQGVDDELLELEGNITIDYTDPEITTFSGAINNGKFQTSLSQYGWYLKIVPVIAKQTYRITALSTSTVYACLKRYPENNLNVADAYASGWTGTRTLASGQSGIVTIPSDGKYLMVRGKDSVPSSREYYQLPKVERVATNSILELDDKVKELEQENIINRGVIGFTNNNIYGDTLNWNTNSIITISSLTLITTNNSRNKKRGYLSRIRIDVASAGTLRCYVGMIDQRNIMVNERGFELTIPNSGVNEIDVRNQNIFIDENEQIFIELNTDTIKLRFVNAEQLSYFQEYGLYAIATPPVNWRFVSYSYKHAFGLNYEVVSTENASFADKKEVEELNNEVSIINKQASSHGIVYDENLLPYRIVVRNGALIPKLLTYSKVVALGNSLTTHPYASSIGWLGNGYAMAATRKETAWTYQFEKILRGYNPNAVVTPFSINSWELNPAINPATITNTDPITSEVTAITDVLTADVDCVIFRAGENNATDPTITQQDYENGLTSLVNYIQTRCPNADIIISNLMWHKADRDNAFQNVAQNLGLTFVNTGNLGNNHEKLGDLCLKYNGSGSSPLSADDLFPVINAGVQGHVNDYGFYLFANLLAAATGLESLQQLHSISVESLSPYLINNSQGVKDSIITVQTFGESQPTITVTDSDNNSIPVTIVDMSSVTYQAQPDNVPTYCGAFIMPNKDITITIN